MKALTTLTLLALAAAGCSDQLVDPNLEGTEHLPTPEPAFASRRENRGSSFSGTATSSSWTPTV